MLTVNANINMFGIKGFGQNGFELETRCALQFFASIAQPL